MVVVTPGMTGRLESETERRRSVATVDWRAFSIVVPRGGWEIWRVVEVDVAEESLTAAAGMVLSPPLAPALR